MKHTKRALALLLTVALVVSALFTQSMTVSAVSYTWAPAMQDAASTDARYQSSIWNSYSSQTSSTVGSPDYANNQTYDELTAGGILNKNRSPYIAYMVKAPADGTYYVKPVYQVGSTNNSSYSTFNLVISVNDTDYYTCSDINYTGSTQWVDKEEDVTALQLKKGVNVIRLLVSPKRPGNVWVNMNCLYVDNTCEVIKCVGKALTLNASASSYVSNWPINAGSGLHNISQGNATMRSEGIKYGNMNLENFKKVPYFSYTVDAPSAGYYDISLTYNIGGTAYAGTGYFVVRVGGRYYKCMFENAIDGNNIANLSVPLEAGTNVISVTSAMEVSSYYTLHYEGYPDWCNVYDLTINGGVTKSATQIDPTTIADTTLPEVVMDGGTYGILNRYSISGNEIGIKTGKPLIGDMSADANYMQSLASMQSDGYFDKSQIPYVSYLVNASAAGDYSLTATYRPSMNTGYSVNDYYMVISVNDSRYYKAYYEANSGNSNWSDSTVNIKLDKGVNTIRCMAVVAETVASVSWLNQDCISITGNYAVTPVVPNLTHLQSNESSYINGFTSSTTGSSDKDWNKGQLNDYRGRSISGAAGLTYDNLSSSNMKNLCYFSYTVDVPADGYYDLSTYISTGTKGATGYLITVIDGNKQKHKVQDANNSIGSNRNNISTYLTAGVHTIAISGIFDHSAYMTSNNGYTDWCNMGAFSISGGIVKSATQIDPLTVLSDSEQTNYGPNHGSIYSSDNARTISGVSFGTNAYLFKTNFRNADSVTLKEGTATVSDSAIVKSGMVVEYGDGIKYTVGSVGGDVNADGKIDIRDIKLSKEYQFGDITLTDVEEGACKFNDDSMIDVNDLVKMRTYIYGKDTSANYKPLTLGAHAFNTYTNPIGRIVLHQNGMMMESSASNFTISGNMRGNVTCTLYVDRIKTDEIGLFVEIDGNTANPTYIVPAYNTVTTITLANNLAEGYHTIKVSKSTDAKNDDIFIYGVTMNGKPSVSQAAAHRIEFIGDSITAGYAAKYPKTTSYYSYANYTADKFKADYYSVANGGWKFGSGSSCLTDIYTKVSMQKSLGDYNFAWKPEIVVINVGTNDGSSPSATDQRRMLTTVREKNPNATIIWAYGMINHTALSQIKSVVDSFAATDKNTYFVTLPQYNDGTDSWHTGPAGHAAAADTLANFIHNLKGWTMY